MNWTQLVDRVIISFNPEETLSPTAKQYLIDAQEDFVLETKCLDRWKWFYVPAEQGYIDLPDDFVQLLRLEHDGQRLDEITLHQPYSIHQSDETKRPGLPEGFYPQGNRVYFYPCYSTAEWVALWYVYKPNVLTDSDTDYRKLAYDALTAHFLVGETITKAAGTATAYDLVFADDGSNPDYINRYGTHLDWTTVGYEVGTVFTVGGATSNNGQYTVTGFADRDGVSNADLQVVTGSFTGEYDVAGTLRIDTATAVIEFDDNEIKTGTLTLSSVSGHFEDDQTLTGDENGSATSNGSSAVFATAGDDPDIPDPYRKYLVDYARSQLYEDRDDIRKADRAMARYMVNSDRIADHFQNRIKTGTTHIIDHYG